VPLETLRDLALAVSEVLTNVVVHAYPNGAPTGTMAVTACIDDRELRVTVADEGVGIAPGAAPRFGLGLTIVAEVADRLELAPADGGGTAVRLAFPAQG
jgi:anti-sigma regulatory factor (Ser/Thr protein kinase)